MKRSSELEGLRGIVTGAARGIGLAIAHKIEQEGGRVAHFDVDPVDLEDSTGMAIAVDVSEPVAVQQTVARVAEHLGGIDFLVNNAGVRRLVSILDTTEDDWRRTLDINLTGAFFCIQAVLPHMLEAGGGRIVNISSTAGQLATSNRAAYCAAKAGVEGLTRAVAVECGGQGIRANAVAPNAIETELTRRYFTDPQLTEKLVSLIPIGTWGHPEDVATLVAFLLRKDAGYINGATLYVDGGWNAGKDVER